MAVPHPSPPSVQDRGGLQGPTRPAASSAASVNRKADWLQPSRDVEEGIATGPPGFAAKDFPNGS